MPKSITYIDLGTSLIKILEVEEAKIPKLISFHGIEIKSDKSTKTDSYNDKLNIFHYKINSCKKTIFHIS